jgi:(2Fe-2S) ferredoxin
MTQPQLDRVSAPVCILVCHNRTCRKQGAVEVFAALRSIVPPDITTDACGCLGKCGNGPMVLVLPARTWYDRVRPQDVSKILAAVLNTSY